MRYELIDSGNGRKLEKFGGYTLVRPFAPAIWKPVLSGDEWGKADAVFSRGDKTSFRNGGKLPDSWQTEIDGIIFKTSLTGFGHLGIFPEQRLIWARLREMIKRSNRKNMNILNLFAYTGGVTLALARENARICHVDASRPSVSWAKENAVLNKMEHLPIRWIVDDVKKFVTREIKRGVKYDAVILDPPSFGRGSKQQVFKIEDDLYPLLQTCAGLLSDDPLLVCLSAHTPGFTGLVLENLLRQALAPIGKGTVESGDLKIDSEKSFPITLGTYAIWNRP